MKKYKIIYADPPWRYDFSKKDVDSIEAHYPTMSIEEICALQVPSEDNALLYLWATAPKLREIAEKYNVSKERIRQITSKEERLKALSTLKVKAGQ